VGQLLGQCLSVVSDNCDPANLTIDGAFAQSYPALAPWLGSGTSSAAPCLPDATTLCLSGGRFKVRATFDTGSASGQAHVAALTGDTGYLWFFGASNVEAVVKVLNGCGLGGHYWVFAGGLTNVKVVITVTDSQTGVAQSYINPLNTAFAPIQDTNAFSTCP
jgi:hypothetical protein